MARPDTVLFVGAGVSAWSGLPTWRGLIAELAEFLEDGGLPSKLVRRELERGDLLQAASFGFEPLTPQDRAAFLRAACRHGTAQPSELHRRIATLGPRAFITTNFDKLLEQALAAERPQLSVRLVNNVDLIETSEIIQSRASDFIFKPHGDIDTSDSVVLTREHYRALRHERRYAFEAFKALIASRPVVFIGFGLRDPDFLLIKDTLAAVYVGAAQDHYAIAADVDDQEAGYWRTNYGIHLVSYEASEETADPARRHAALLDLLTAVAAAEQPREAPPEPAPAASSDSATLAILRHARRVAQLGPAPEVEILPLAALPYSRQGSVAPAPAMRAPFVRGDAVTGLRRNQARLLLTGPPGAGKTFVVRAAGAQMAKAVIEEALETEGGENGEPVPSYIDLRDYTGDLWQMVVGSFPVGFPLDELVSGGRLAFFLDGLNEVSARIVEDNTLYNDLSSFLERIGSCSVVLVTRFGEEHAELRLPEIALESLPRDHVLAKLEEKGVPAATLSQEFLGLLERPFFYRFCLEHELWDKRTPHAIYSALIARLNERARERFGPVDLMELFGRVAFDSIDAGDLQIPVAELTDRLRDTDLEPGDASEVVNWLLAEGSLVPRLGQHVTFFHHSVTEYLAAHELVACFRADRGVLRRTLLGRRWDQVVLLAIGFLAESEQQEFFDEVMRTDVELCLRALAYLDEGWERWTSEALRHLPRLQLSGEATLDVAEALWVPRFGEQHEPLLLRLSERRDNLGGVALARTLEFGGEERIRRAIDDLFEHGDLHSRCTDVGVGLRGCMDRQLARYLLDRLRHVPLDQATLEAIEAGEDRRVLGLVAGCRRALEGFGLRELRAELRPLAEEAPLVLKVVIALLPDDRSGEAIALAAELLAIKPNPVSAALHSRLAFGDDTPDLSPLRPDVHGPILLGTDRGGRDGSSIDTLRQLGRYSEEWLKWVCERAEEAPEGIKAAMLWYSAQRQDRFFSTLRSLLRRNLDWSAEPLDLLRMASDIEWHGHRDLFLDLLRERNDDLAVELLQQARVWNLRFDLFADLVDTGEVEWWVDWLLEAIEDGGTLPHSLGQFLAAAVTPEAGDVLLDALENGTDEERRALVYYVLGYVPGLRLSSFPEEVIEWALADLETRSAGKGQVEMSLLAGVATEAFVEDVLLPEFEAAGEPYRSNLLALIQQAGERHRRRYVTTTGEPL